MSTNDHDHRGNDYYNNTHRSSNNRSHNNDLNSKNYTNNKNDKKIKNNKNIKNNNNYNNNNNNKNKGNSSGWTKNYDNSNNNTFNKNNKLIIPKKEQTFMKLVLDNYNAKKTNHTYKNEDYSILYKYIIDSLEDKSLLEILTILTFLLKAYIIMPYNYIYSCNSLQIIQLLTHYCNYDDLPSSSYPLIHEVLTSLNDNILLDLNTKSPTFNYKLSASLNEFENIFLISFKKLNDLNSDTLMLREKISKYIKFFKNSIEQKKSKNNNLEILNNPTLKSLCDPFFTKLVNLPIVFNNTLEFSQLILKQTILLSFFWGASSFYPICQCDGCGNPLMYEFSNEHYYPCTMKFSTGEVCTKEAKYRCYSINFSLHKSYSCQDCAEKWKNIQFGYSQVSNISKNFYDAKIFGSTNTMGDAYITCKDVKPRNPHKSKNKSEEKIRLEKCNLVGIIQLGDSKNLSPEMKIQFGEVEDKQTVKNSTQITELKIKLIKNFSDSTLNYHLKNNILIIDFKVFAPEVANTIVQILSPSFLQLNKYILRPILGIEYSSKLPIQSDNFTLNMYNCLKSSKIEYLKNADSIELKNIALKLSQNRMIISMDRTQRDAYLKSLIDPFHITQGPPGTGKSYLGHALVATFLCIKEELKIKRPLLVISYKNCAVDDFLISLKEIGINNMIRIGKSKHKDLEGLYEDRQTKIEIECRDAILAAVKKLFKAKEYFNIILNNTIDPSKIDPDFICWMLHLNINYDESLFISDSYIFDYFTQVDKFNFDLRDFHENFSFFKQFLKNWIRGTREKKKCMSEDCYNSVDSSENFCKDHKCIISKCKNNKVQKNSYSCKVHKCSVIECMYPKFNSIYCAFHQCSNCLKFNNFSFVSKYGYGCEMHKCSIKDCNNAQLAPFKMCHKIHTCKVCIQNNSVTEESIAIEGYKLCKYHKCKVEKCENTSINNEISWCTIHYCTLCEGDCKDDVHKCKANDCQNFNCTLLDKMQKYCDKHICLRCSFNNGNQTEGGQDFFCSQHNLCKLFNWEGPKCDQDCDGEAPYCKDHKISQKAKVSDNCQFRGCKNKKPPTFSNKVKYFCPNHEKKGFISPSSTILESNFCLSKENLFKCKSFNCPTPFYCHDFQLNYCIGHEKLIVEEEEVYQETNIFLNELANITSKPRDEFNKHNNEFVVDYNNIDSDIHDFESDTESETELLKERRDTYCIGDRSEDESEEFKKIENLISSNNINEILEEKRKQYLNNPNKCINKFKFSINWEDTLEQRVNILKELFSNTLKIYFSIENSLNNYIDKLKGNYNIAKANRYSTKDIICGTATSTLNKIDSIRYAKPFFLLVEESCELMESLLLSCLSISTLNKIEMIGDPQQLPASVSSFWFHHKLLMNNIEKSLFERVYKNNIDKITNSESVVNVLDIQRRMRGEIAILTKGEYKINIIDGENTSNRQNPEILKNANFNEVKKITNDDTVCIPFVKENVLFWNLTYPKDFIEKNSKVNNYEINCIFNIVSFLINVSKFPPNAITVLTYYKAQKLALISFFNDKKMSKDITIQTVDSYQGNENDIVLLSTVRTKIGNKYLQNINRLIVALTRARIGLFVIGLIGTFLNQVNYSNNTFEKSKGNAPHNVYKIFENFYKKNLISDKFKLCCNLHRANTCFEISQKDDFPTSIKQMECYLDCGIKLTCGHNCKKQCHSEKDNFNIEAHDCHTIIGQKTCHFHNGKDVYCRNKEELIKCSEIINFELNCGHAITIPCHQYLEKSINNPKCDHRVTILLPCGHEKSVFCHEKNKNHKCDKIIEFSRPSCGHKIKLQCNIAEDIKNLSNYVEPQFKLNKENESVKNFESKSNFYNEHDFLGPNFKKCSNYTRYTLRCGHTQKIKCCDFIDQILISKDVEFKYDVCCEMKEFKCFLCNDKLFSQKCSNLTIFYEDLKKKFSNCKKNVSKYIELLKTVNLSEEELKLFTCKGSKKVELKYECGHSNSTQCSDLFSYLLGHKKLPCSILCEKIETLKCNHSVTFSSCDSYTNWKGEGALCFTELPYKFRHCGHNGMVKCCSIEDLKIFEKNCPDLKGDNELVLNDAFRYKNYYPNEKIKFTCNEMTKVKRSCGHTEIFKCTEAFELVSNPEILSKKSCKVCLSETLKKNSSKFSTSNLKKAFENFISRKLRSLDSEGLSWKLEFNEIEKEVYSKFFSENLKIIFNKYLINLDTLKSMNDIFDLHCFDLKFYVSSHKNSLVHFEINNENSKLFYDKKYNIHIVLICNLGSITVSNLLINEDEKKKMKENFTNELILNEIKNKKEKKSEKNKLNEKKPEEFYYLLNEDFSIQFKLNIGMLKLENILECSFCMSPYDSHELIHCKKDTLHVNCFECFENYIKNSLSVDSISSYTNNKFEIKCAKCDYFFTLSDMRYFPSNIFETYNNLLFNRLMDRKEKECEEKFEKIFNKRLEEALKSNGISKIIRDINDNICTNKCPECNCAFYDFDGCAAVTCNCRAHFCGLCFKNCGADAHPHVMNCKYNPSTNYFVAKEEIQKIWKTMKKEKIINKFQEISSDIQDGLLKDSAFIQIMKDHDITKKDLKK